MSKLHRHLLELPQRGIRARQPADRAALLAAELYGLGALDLLLDEGQRAGTITDIYVNSPCDIWVGINGTTRPWR